MDVLFFFLIFILNNNKIVNRVNGLNTASTLDVLYLFPEDANNIFNLNEKKMLGNGYNKGWILPSDVSLTLNLFLYYDGTDERRLNSFFHTSINSHSINELSLTSTSFVKRMSDNLTKNFFQKNGLAKNKRGSLTGITNFHPEAKAILYMYFTPETHCNEYRSHQPLEITEKISSNMYKAELKSISLPYSSKPYFICMQQFDSDEDLYDSKRYFSHQGTDYWISIITTRELLPIWARIILFCILLSLSGLFSGLNLGLMSLDLSELEILKRIGTSKEQSFASKIYPLRKKGNLLLCTILLGNVLVNSTSTLILGDMLSGIYAALGSTLLIVVFGEIIPQAACSKHGLAVGAYTRYITYFFMFLTFPLSFPISIILDKILGKEIAATYTRDKIRELMKNVKDLNEKEFRIISGALDFNKKKVKEVMTKIEDVFMLEKNERLDFETIAKISQHGFSRIPVYEVNRENVVGLLHVKDFTLLDPDDNMPVKAILEFYNHKTYFCDSDKPIDDMFEEFRKGETHLAFVTEIIQHTDQDPYDLCVGIVTLEDILEELVQMEIYDEFDDKNDLEKENLENINEVNDSSSLSGMDNNDNKNLLSIEIKKGVETVNHFIKTERKSSTLSNTKKISCPNAKYNQNTTELTNDSFLLDTLQGSQKNNAKREEILGQETKIENKQKTINNKSSSRIGTVTTPHYESQASHDLSFFIQQQKDSDSGQRALISPQIRFVMFQFLFTTVKPFTSEFLTKNVLELIFKRVSFKESRRTDPRSLPEYLYTYGKGCNYFILILSGEATIEVGQEKLEFPAGPFAYFGSNALLCNANTADEIINEDLNQTTKLSKIGINDESKSTRNYNYVPDFSLRIDDHCVYMKLDRELWKNGVVKSIYEVKNNEISDNIDYFTTELENECSDLKNESSQSPSLLFKNKRNEIFSNNIQLKSGRRSTIAATMLAKAKLASNASKTTTPTNQKLRSKYQQVPLNELIELENENENFEKFSHIETDEKETFLDNNNSSKLNSTFSLAIENDKNYLNDSPKQRSKTHNSFDNN